MVHSTALRYFAEVARTGSLAAASENLHVAVSAVSRQISRLEQQIGAALFDRMPRGMVLTRPGEVLAEHARRTLLEANAVLAEISTAHARVRSVLRIGCDEPFTLSFLPAVMAAFHRKQPCARFIVRSGVPDAVEQWVEAGEVDVGVSFSAGSAAAVNAVCSVRVPAEALCREGHPLAGKSCLELEDLLAYPVAVPERDALLRRLFDSRCAAEGRQFEPLLVTDSASLIHQFVSLTDGIAVGNGSLLQGQGREGLVALTIDEPLLNERRLRVITMEGRRLPATVSQFLETVKSALAEVV